MVKIVAASTGDKLKLLRLREGMTQKELADKLGVTPQNISQYERGLKKPKIETVQKMADALGVDVSEIIPQKQILDLDEMRLRSLYYSSQEYEDQEAFAMSMMELNSEGHKMLMRYLEYLKSVPEYRSDTESPSFYEAEYSGENHAENARQLSKRYQRLADACSMFSKMAEELAQKFESKQPAGADTVKVKELVYSGGGVGVPVSAGDEDAEIPEDTDGNPFAAPVPVGG